MREDITKSLAAGQAEDDIIARYVAEYGEKVLSSPTHEGFNLLAWWGPYVALVLGAMALTVAIRRIGGKARRDPAEARAPDDTSPELRARLDRELEKNDS